MLRLEEYKKKIFNKFDGKRVSENILRSLIGIDDYITYYRLINKMVNESFLQPIKRSGSNGMNPPLYRRYQVIKIKDDFKMELKEIRLLDDSFNIEGYINKPKLYKDNKKQIQNINSFLKDNYMLINYPASINERSFQIFGQEKALKEDKVISKILKFNPKLNSKLNYYLTPEPFFEYDILRVEKESSSFNVLIIENKDTWYTLRKLIVKKRCHINGIYIHKVLYGEGKKISRKINSLTEYADTIYQSEDMRFYYFGDLDYEGIGIFEDLIAINTKLKIELMEYLYKKMIELSIGKKLPDMKEKQRHTSSNNFMKYFSQDDKVKIDEILEAGCYIPQEIICYEEWMKILSEMRD